MDTIQITAYLVITNGGGLRVVKTRPYLNNNEIALTLKLNIPQAYFDRLMPIATINVPDDAVVGVNPEVAVNLAAEAVSEALKLDIIEVRDGLKELVLNREEAKT